MTVKDLTEKIENGSCCICLYDTDGIVLCSTIWVQYVPEKYLDKPVRTVTVRDYELRLEIQL